MALVPAYTHTSQPKRYHRLYAWIAMLFFMGIFTHLMGSSDGDPGPLSILYQPIAAIIYLMAALLLFATRRYRGTLFGYLAAHPWMVLSLILILASTLWSIDPAVTARKSVAVLATTMIGLFIGFLYASHDFVGLLRHVYLLFIVLSFLVSIVLPEYGVHHDGGEHDGRWRGLMTFKNQMAWTAALFLVLWISRLRVRSLIHPSQAIPLILGIIVLVKCGSATGALQAIFGLSLLFVFRMYMREASWRTPFILITIAGILTILYIAEVLLATYLAYTDRTDTLSGRTVIWTEVWPYIMQRPWLGFGQSAFWSDATRFFGETFWVGSRNHSHNAYIEVLIDLGIVGLFFQMMFLLGLCKRLWKVGMSGDENAPILLALVASMLLSGIAGAMFFRPNTGTWILICAISAYIYRVDIGKKMAQLKSHKIQGGSTSPTSNPLKGSSHKPETKLSREQTIV